jgi:hypothetical protein
MTDTDTNDPVRAGVDAYAGARYFAAHEHFEDAWKTSGVPRSLELHALAQVAAAVHKRTVHGKPEAARAIMQRAQAKIAGLAGAHVDLDALRAGIDAWLCDETASAPPILLRTRR